MRFQIVVSGFLFYETECELVAGHVAAQYRRIGWKDVKIRDTYEIER